MADFGFANKSNSSDFSSTGDKSNEVFGDLLLNRTELEAMITSLKRRQYGATPPASPNTGDIWECSTTGGGYTATVVYRYNGSAWAELIASAVNIPNRNTVIQGKVTAAGAPDLFEAGTGLAVKLNATATPAIFAFMNGNSTSLGTVDIVASVSADSAAFWSSLPTSSTVYLYVDYTTGTVSGGFTTLAPVYQNIAPTHSAGLHWLDFNTGKVWSSDGSSWTQRNRIFVGTATTDGSGVTAVDVYAYNQMQKLTVSDIVAEDVITKGPWVDVRAFGAVLDGVTDNYDAIIDALNYLDSNSNGGTLLFPIGICATSPFSMQGYNGITLKGMGGYIPYTTCSQIKFIAAGDIGIQFSAPTTTHAAPTWSAVHYRVEDLYLNCNDIVDIGINGNYDITLKRVSVRNALVDGIVLENYTYPALLEDVDSSNNGRHGVYVKGPMTTCYTMNRFNASGNDGYGILLEGGFSVNITDPVIQSNKRGGIKLSWVGDNYTGDYFLSQITLNNPYTEANGTLEVGDANYEGNYALVVTSMTLMENTTKKISYVTVNGGALNAAATTGKSYNLQAVYGFTFNNTQVVHTLGTINSPYCHSLFSSAGPSSAVGAAVPYPFIGSYGQNDNNATAFLVYSGGVIGTRGRVQTYAFYVPSIAAGATVNMAPTLFINDGGTWTLEQAIHLLQRSTLLGVILKKRYSGGVNAGTLTAKLTYGYDDGGGIVGVQVAMPTTEISLATENIKRTICTPLQYAFATKIFGVQLVASADYVTGSDTAVLVYVMVES